MELFEVLIILVFIVLPLLEGVFKRRRGDKTPKQQPAPRQRERVGAGARQEAERGGVATADEEGRDQGSAADMIPGDLWEVLTGERRTPTPGPSHEPWESDWPGEISSEEEAAAEVLTSEEVGAPWEIGDWDVSRSEGQVEEPVSLEYVGPEAYSLEGPPPPPEARHRLYHEKYDTAPMPPPETGNAFARSLRQDLQGDALRRSVLIAEILGPPKGLA